MTPRLVRLLKRLDVPATFFMVGSRVASAPDTARLVERAGFAIGNHTWLHTDLTTQSDKEIRQAIRSTHRAMIDAGLQPTDFVRPPYGAVDDRVRRVLTDLGYRTVLWTIDSRDWTGLSPRQIDRGVLGAVHPHRTNLVLQHDGVTNSPATLKALPDEIATLRRRGYCFAELNAHGSPTPPVPTITVHPDRSRIREGERVRLTVRLDRPTTRATAVHTTAGAVRIPAGERVAHLAFRAPQDRTDEKVEDVKVFDHAVIHVVDDDPRPVVSLRDATVTASPLVPVPASFDVRLDRQRDRPLRVVVHTGHGRIQVVVPAHSTRATGSLSVPVGTPRQKVRNIALRAEGATATLTVRPPEQTYAEALHDLFDHVDWPRPTVGLLF